MNRYIDADNMKSIKNIQSANFNSIESIREWIDSQPTADVVEVVRCKDCKHFRDRKLKLLDDIYECKLTGLVTELDNFCKYGEGV